MAIAQGDHNEALTRSIQFATMQTPNTLTDQLSIQIDQLLQRLHSAEDGCAQLHHQVESLTQERDGLIQRLNEARDRVDALLVRLPDLQNILEGKQ